MEKELIEMIIGRMTRIMGIQAVLNSTIRNCDENNKKLIERQIEILQAVINEQRVLLRLTSDLFVKQIEQEAAAK